MRIDQWDREIAPYLQGVERDASWLEQNAAGLQRKVHILSARPDWETKAQDGMARAEAALARALEAVRAARAEYEAKPCAA